MASDAAVLIAGVDTLIVNMKVPPMIVTSADGTTEQSIPITLPGEMDAQLFQWQELAKQEEKPYITPWVHEGIALKMQPRGTPTHRYLLRNGLIDLLVGPTLHNGAYTRVRFMSEYLWRGGADAALLQTHEFLWNQFQLECQLQCAEIHLCADMVNFRLPRNYEPFFI